MTLNITKEFLEEALQEEIENFELHSGSNLGDGHSGCMTAIEVSLKKSKNVRHLILKSYPTHPTRQEFLAKTNVFWTELCVYNSLAPELTKFQENDEQLAIVKPPFPDFVYGRAINYTSLPSSESKICLDPLDNCVMMPDLRKNGNFRLADRRVVADLDHCKLVMEALAKMHSLSWAYKEKLGLQSLAEKFPFLGESFYDLMDRHIFDGMFDNAQTLFCTAVEAQVTQEDERSSLTEAVRRARVKVPDLMDLYNSNGQRLMDPSLTKDNCLRVPAKIRQDETPWLVTVHSDCHFNNMMFRYDEETGRPLEVILLDLQGMREGDPLGDICKAIFTSTDSSFRKKYMSQLLQIYVDTFGQICDQCQARPPCDFNFEEIQRRFHRAKAFAFTVCLMGLPFILNDPKDAVDLDKEIEDGAQADEIFDEMANSTKNVATASNFQVRALDLVREFYGEGVI